MRAHRGKCENTGKNRNIWNNRRKRSDGSVPEDLFFESLDFTLGARSIIMGRKIRGKLSGGYEKGRMEESMSKMTRTKTGPADHRDSGIQRGRKYRKRGIAVASDRGKDRRGQSTVYHQ